MDFKGKRVLVLEGYARQSLPLIKAFHKLGCRVCALCDSKLDVAYVSRYTDEKILTARAGKNAGAATERVRQLLKTGNYDIVVPAMDFSAGLLSENKAEFMGYSRVCSNDWAVHQIAADKIRTMQICMEKGIPCPNTILNVADGEQVLNSDIKYPIVVKPRVGYGAIGFRRVDSKEEVRALFDEGLDPADYVFQEYIPQKDLQYECAMFLDDKNKVKTSLVFSKNRWFPVDGGSSTLNITVERPDIVESCTKLLQAINWRGAADIDLIQDPRDNIAKIIEINPRVSGSVKICFISGVDLARQMLELAHGREVTKYDRYKIGQRLRCSQTDLLWFIKSKNRFKSKPSWFSIRNTKDHTFSWDDPLPWFAFSVQGIKRAKKEMEKRGV